MKVFIDSREQSRIKQASEYYTKQGLTVEVQELPIGDYLFSNGEDSVCFEFKTIADFISSIQDNRVFNEALNQAENYNHHFVVIQGDESTRAKCLAFTKNYRRVTIFQYHGAIASLNRYTTVLESYSSFIDEAFYKMLVQTRKCLSDKPIVRKFPKKTSNTAFNFLCGCIYGINSKKANNIVNTYHLESLADLMTLTQEDLMKIDGIGENTAKKIISSLKGVD